VVIAYPIVVDGEDIVRDPHHVGGISFEKPLHFVYDPDRITTAVGLAIDAMTAPLAGKGAASRCDEVD
jgi:hypothetical protein